MTINQLVVAWVNRNPDTKSKRQIGRYWTCDLYNIIKGKMTPEKYFLTEPIEEQGTRNITSGIITEDGLSRIFSDMKVNVECQVKKEIEIAPGIILVVKPDFVFPDYILEVKCPTRPLEDIPEWYAYQCEAYYRGFFLPVYLGSISHPFWVKQMEYTPSKIRWKKICNALIEFDAQLRKYNEQQ